ncbi:uncharacterized protein LOC144434368 [Glandiceps talaboti]
MAAVSSRGNDYDDEDILYEQDTGKQDQRTLLGSGIKTTQYSDEKTPHRCVKTGLLCAGFLGMGLCTSILGTTLLDLGSGKEASLQTMSYAVTSRSVGILIGAITAGFCFDRFDQHMLLALSLFGLSSFGALVPWCTNIVMLFIAIGFWGLALGFFNTGGNIVCVNIWGRKTGPFVQALHFSFGLGAFIAPLIAEPFLNSYSLPPNVTDSGNTSIQISRDFPIPCQPQINTIHVDTRSIEFFPNNVEFHADDNAQLDHSDVMKGKLRDTRYIDDQFATFRRYHREDQDTDNTQNGDDKDTDKMEDSGDQNTDKTQDSGDEDTDKTEDSGDKDTDKTEDSGDKDTDKTEDSGDKDTDKMEDSGDKDTDKTEDSGDQDTDKTEDSGDKDTDKTEDSGDKDTDKTEDSGDKDTDKTEDSGDKDTDKTEDSGDKDTDKTEDSGDKDTDKTEDSGDKDTDKTEDSGDKDTDKTEDSGDKDTDKTEDSGDKDTDKTEDSDKDTDKMEDSGDKDTDKTEDSGDKDTDKTEDSGDKDTDKTEDSGDKDTDKTEDSGDKDTDKTEDSGDKDTDKTEDSGDKDTDKMEDSGDQDTDKTQDSGDQDKDKTENGDEKNIETSELQTDDEKNGTKSGIINSVLKMIPHASQIQKAYMIIAMYNMLVSLPFVWFFCSGPRLLISQRRAAVSAGVDSYTSGDSKLFRFILLTGLFVFFFLYQGIEEAYGAYIYTFAKCVQLQFTSEQASYLNATFWGTFALGRFLSICIASVLSPKLMLIPDILGVVLSLVLLATLGSTNSSILWSATVGLGLCMASIFPAAIAWAERYILLTGKATASFFIASSIAGIVIPWFLGLLFSVKGITVLMPLLMGLAIVLFLLFIILQLMASRHGERSTSTLPESGAKQLLSAIEEEVIELENIRASNGRGKSKGRRSGDKHKLSQTIREIKKDSKND